MPQAIGETSIPLVPSKRAAGGALDQLMGQSAVVDLAARDKDFGSRVGQLGHRLVDRRQRRPDGAGERGVVEPGDGKGRGDVDPARMRFGEDAGGHVVIRGENRRRRLGPVEQRCGCTHAAVEIELAVYHQRRLERDAGAVQRLAIAVEPLLARHVARVALDEADSPMAVIDEVGGHVVARLNVIHEHRAGQRVVCAGRNAHERNVERVEHREHRCAVGHRRGQDDPVDVSFRNQPAHLRADRRIVYVDRLREQADALRVAIVPAALLDLEGVVRAVVVVDQGDLVRFRARQDARRDAWAKVEIGHRRLYPLARRRTDVGVPVEHAADRLDRDPGARSDIADVRPAAHPPSPAGRPANSGANALPCR
jgi:hypothetical protein